MHADAELGGDWQANTLENNGPPEMRWVTFGYDAANAVQLINATFRAAVSVMEPVACSSAASLLPPRRSGQRFVPPLLPPHRRQHRQASAQHRAEDPPHEGASPAFRARETAQTFGLGFDRDWDPLAVLQVCSPGSDPEKMRCTNLYAEDNKAGWSACRGIDAAMCCDQSMRRGFTQQDKSRPLCHAQHSVCRIIWRRSMQLEAAGASRRPSDCRHPAVMLQPLHCRAPATSISRVITRTW